MPNLTIQDRRSKKRNLILQAARRCFVKRGFHATGMAEICHAAKMSPGNLYRYYPSKSAIILAIVEETRQQVMPIYENLKNLSDPVGGIVQIVVHSFEYFSDPKEYRLWIEIIAEASRNAEIRKSCRRFDQQVQSVLRSLLQAGIKSHQIAPKVDEETALMWLVTLVDSSIFRGSSTSFFSFDWTPKNLNQRVRNMLEVRPSIIRSS